MRIAAAFAFIMTASSALGAEWASIKSSAAGSSVEFNSSEKHLSLNWSDIIVPGEQLLLSAVTYKIYPNTFYQQYRFAGVHSNSIQIDVQGGGGNSKPSVATKDSSMTKTIFIERASDGAFYFIPEDLKGEASFKLENNPKEAGSYSVKLIRVQK